MYDQETSSYVKSQSALGYHVAIHAAEGAHGNLLPLIDSGEVTQRTGALDGGVSGRVTGRPPGG